MPDESIRCARCGPMFVWEVGEQEFYAEKRFAPPKNCAPCRKAKRVEREMQAAPAGDPERKR